RSDNPDVDFVPDAIVDRFCLLGPVSAHVEQLRELADAGADQFALYLMHDQEEETLAAYGSQIIPLLG
ncbi:MAG TPA: TIGR03842 family LLM class F420-dependent oxidoreductase, partial [Streptosporangiaceae bacterium]|nr:TIGR03842 family LLM class F420-dependent oxidoreductase [Streptosporangiaceae bacterium]